MDPYYPFHHMYGRESLYNFVTFADSLESTPPAPLESPETTFDRLP